MHNITCICNKNLHLKNADKVIGLETFNNEIVSELGDKCNIYHKIILVTIKRNIYKLFAPIIIRPTDRKKYLSAIEKYQTKNDEESYIKFMLRILNRSMKITINMFEIENMAVQTELLTISKYAKYKGVPISTIRYWVEIGKIKPTSYTDSGYMLFEKD